MVFSFQTSNTFSFFLLWRVLQCVPGMIKTPLAKVVSKDDEHETDTLGEKDATVLCIRGGESERKRARGKQVTVLHSYSGTRALTYILIQ